MHFFRNLADLFRRRGIFRSEFHIWIKQFSIADDAKILDLGSGESSSYRELIKNKTITVDINAKNNPDILMDLEKDTLPSKHHSKFDYVFAFNVMEHIYNYNNVLRNAHKALKKGGQLLIVVPFLAGIHGMPRDFARYTNYHLERSLKEAGFRNIDLRSIDAGFFMLWFNFIQHSLWFGTLRSLAYIAASVSDAISMPIFNFLFRKKIQDKFPLGYMIRAEK